MEQPRELVAEQAYPWARREIALPVFALLSLVGAFFPSFSVRANVYILLLGGVMLTVGFSTRMPRRSAPDTLPAGVVWWLLPIGIFALVEAITFFLRSPEAYPTLSLLMDPVLEDYWIRSFAYFGWLAAFWTLVRR